ncbi:MAG: glutamate synthase large subunit [Deltaproteobacteria bacterium]|nr:glutamate synthase large subunit [Deltaproteobacteria bacterium]
MIPAPTGLFDPAAQHDSCGTGFVANILGYKSHDILEKGLTAVTNLTHRGAVSSDGKTGDGAGILAQIPTKIFKREVKRLGYESPDDEDLAIGMIFFPRNDLTRERCRQIIEEIVGKYQLTLFGWRPVPTNPEALGEKAAKVQPAIEQILIGRSGPVPKASFEQVLFTIRKEIEAHVLELSIDDFYIPSFSSRVIIYKALCIAPQLAEFYLDLKNPDFETALVLYHQRFSTNTFPTWALAQPFRYCAHNGEINTIAGNRNWMKAREPELSVFEWSKTPKTLRPIIQPRGSDSASFDNALETLIMGGRNILHTAAMLIPEAWENKTEMDPDLRAFYEYHALFTEAWDGPAAIAFSDGQIVGALLDRNGLRPARYIVTDDNLIIMGSEVGTIELDERRIIKKGRLGPGKMIAVDTVRGKLLTNEEIKKQLSSFKPYRQWLEENLLVLKSNEETSAPPKKEPADPLTRRQKMFGYSEEEIQLVVRAMAMEAKDPVFSMGDDTPLAVLSGRPRLLYSYFKQLFAQVTNPAIDPIREAMVMSLNTYLAPRKNIFAETPEHARRLKLSSPILLPHQFEELKNRKETGFESVTLQALFPVSDGPEGLEETLFDLCGAASHAIEEGKRILIISDRDADERRAPIPMLLAVSAVHHHLIREGQRMIATLVTETGDARDIHHFGCLIGYGTAAIYPYLAYETLTHEIERGFLPNLDLATAQRRFQKAVETGLLKIISKMGISTISSYRSAQIFEAIGLQRSVINRYFTGTPSRVGGIGLEEIARDTLTWHNQAFSSDIVLSLGGYYRFRRGEEYHAFNPDVVKAIHASAKSGVYEDYKKYANLVHERPPTTLRDLLEFKIREPIPLEEVEPVEEIRKRFTTSSISYGALSIEAHRDLAIAMNRIGAKSGSGEGGEDPARYKPLPNGDSANSAIKQVASARFGVTTEYLLNAKELEIKMAQGSKPGEGGQLPGHKVSDEIARVRHAQPGVTLISPPPHHDIYSIEDLKQLIYDLKQVSPEARIGVKLVSENGVGTIAAGVAKAHADVILISGHEGGTGASPASSIKNAGSAWELGLAEAQQTLVMNDLRGKVLLRVDGGMKTGRDVVVAALLGAEEYGFGTAPLIAEGCVMARQCHLNTCPVGVTTHDEQLRKKYVGTPERIIHFMNGVAGEVREILASLGFRSLDEVIGRVDLLQPKKRVEQDKIKHLDLSPILTDIDPEGKRAKKRNTPRNNFPIEPSLDQKILQDGRAAIEGKGDSPKGDPPKGVSPRRSVKLSYPIRNIHRTVGARVAGEVAKRYGDKGLPDGILLECSFKGTAGQSFGAFAVPGLRWILIGQANDYVGKGMTGGEIVIRPHPKARYASHENVIMGNTVLYGATGGSLFASGQAGERFCVRNSGAVAVVEGVGDHGCEYMTGGVVVVLGEVGQNFGAGMTGGEVYLFDELKSFESRYNQELIELSRLENTEDADKLHQLVLKHFEFTQSPHAERILKKWNRFLPLFWKVSPKNLKQIQNLTAAVGETDQPKDFQQNLRA